MISNTDSIFLIYSSGYIRVKGYEGGEQATGSGPAIGGEVVPLRKMTDWMRHCPKRLQLPERATGFEPVTSSLGSWHSTPELRPRNPVSHCINSPSQAQFTCPGEKPLGTPETAAPVSQIPRSARNQPRLYRHATTPA